MTKRERFRPFWDRFVWDLKHLADDEINPYVAAGEGDALPKNRTGLEDVTHAFKNLFVEGWRIMRAKP